MSECSGVATSRPQNRDFITGFGTIGSEIIDENFKYDLEEKIRNVDE